MEIRSFKIKDFNNICNIFRTALKSNAMTEQDLNMNLKNTLSGLGGHTYCFFDQDQLIGFVVLQCGKVFYEETYKTIIDFIYLPDRYCVQQNIDQIVNVINTWADEKGYKGIAVGDTAFLQAEIKPLLFKILLFNKLETVWETA